MHRRKRRGEERGFKTSNLKSRGEERRRADRVKDECIEGRGEERREGLRQVSKRAEERSGEEQRGWKTNA